MKMSTIFRKTSGKSSSLPLANAVGTGSLVLVVALSGYVSGGESAFATALLITAYAFLFYLVRIFYCRIASREYPKLADFLLAYVRKMGVFSLAVMLCGGIFTVYQNEIDPAKLPEYVISNGEKTVRFRAMAHIGSESFYNGVGDDLAAARKDGYVLFYEGVRPGSPENTKKFDAMMGFKFDKDLYASMSKLYGLVPQNTAAIVGAPGPDDRNVDLGIDEIVANFEKRRGAVSGEPSVSPPSPETEGVTEEFSKEIAAYANSLAPRELATVRYLNRAIMSLVIKNRDASAAAFAGLGKADLFSSILDDRNKVIVDAITSTDQKKIFITYGLLHFDGVFDQLQEKDHRWKISGPIRYRYPTLP
ncbi:MAG: hypothetical protein QG650_1066 [Patescibacteria group bacterium]|nr:hypothetical protein [Patescibacteria group bacterium]